MLLVTFQVNNQRYAINTAEVRQIIPMVQIRKLPGTPDCVLGTFSFHGTLVPVLDITAMLTGTPAPMLFSTRIILVQYPGTAHLLGLLAECATQTVVGDNAVLADSGVNNTGAPWLGKISVGEKDLMQIVTVEKLLTDELKSILFTAAKEKS